MATPATASQYLQQVYQNTLTLMVLVDMAIANPTQANIDAVVQSPFATGGIGAMVPKPSTSQDGESYDWVGYRQHLIESLLPIEKAIQRAGGPYLIRQRNRV